MTGKRVIIDNVDVSECIYFYKNECNNLNYTSCECNKYPNCYYKQLKLKKYEYEDLRQYHNKCCKENAEKLEQWLDKFNQVSRDFFNGKYCNKEYCNLLKTNERDKLYKTNLENLNYINKELTDRNIELIEDLRKAQTENFIMRNKIVFIKKYLNDNIKYRTYPYGFDYTVKSRLLVPIKKILEEQNAN